jgi:hypothetical protein
VVGVAYSAAEPLLENSACPSSRLAGELDSGNLTCSDYQVMLFADIFASGGDLYVIMGAGGGANGGIDLYARTTEGCFVERGRFSGPAEPMVRGTAHGRTADVSERFGSEAITSVSLQGL